MIWERECGRCWWTKKCFVTNIARLPRTFRRSVEEHNEHQQETWVFGGGREREGYPYNVIPCLCVSTSELAVAPPEGMSIISPE